MPIGSSGSRVANGVYTMSDAEKSYYLASGQL